MSVNEWVSPDEWNIYIIVFRCVNMDAGGGNQVRVSLIVKMLDLFADQEAKRSRVTESTDFDAGIKVGGRPGG